LDAWARFIVTADARRGRESTVNFALEMRKSGVNREFCRLEIGVEKVAAHETFAELLRLYL